MQEEEDEDGAVADTAPGRAYYLRMREELDPHHEKKLSEPEYPKGCAGIMLGTILGTALIAAGVAAIRYLWGVLSP